jgi:hypothetical protein
LNHLRISLVILLNCVRHQDHCFRRSWKDIRPLVSGRNIYCRDFYDFSIQMPWLQNVTNNDEPLTTNWLLIFRYLLSLIEEEKDAHGLFVIGQSIVDAESGISFPYPEIIPLCFVLLTSMASTMKVGETPHHVHDSEKIERLV